MNEIHYSSKDMTWETPPDLFRELDEEFNFTLDPCCVPETAKCDKFFTPIEDGLSQSWIGERVFVNPPYGREIKHWVRKSWEEGCNVQNHHGIVVMLIPARTDTSWFHQYIYGIAEVRFLRGRIKFLQDGIQKDSAPFPAMIVIFRNDD